MAKVIGIMGESGAGKTSSMRNLDSKTTFYVDTDKKGLNWKGWKTQYNGELKNYVQTDAPSIVMSVLKHVNEDDAYKHIETVVVDTLNGIMVAEEMRNAKVNGYGKWTDLATYIYEICDYALTMRDDLTVIIVAHSETVSDDNGQVFTRIRTNGRKLEKIVLESKMTTVLLADNHDGKYVFHTRAEHSTCKTPMGAFEADEIENDVTLVIEALKEF